MDSKRPIKKIEAAGQAAVFAIVLIYVAKQMGFEMPVEVANAVVALVICATGYLKTDPLIAEARELLKKKLEHEAREGDGE